MSSTADDRQSLPEAKRFIEELTGDANTVMCFRTVPESAAAKLRFYQTMTNEMRKRFRLNFRGTISDLSKTLKLRNEQGFAIYYVLNETDGKGTRNENVVNRRAVPLDLDNAGLPAKWPGEMPPQITVESSPGKFQCLFLIRPTNNADEVTAVTKRLAIKLGGDTRVCDPARVLRMPGFLHQKGQPFLSRIVHINEFDPPYRYQVFKKLLPELPPRAKASAAGIGVLDGDGARRLFSELKPEEFGSNDEWEPLAMSLHAVSNSDGEVEDLFLEWCSGDENYADESIIEMNRYRYRSFKANKEGGRGIGTLWRICKRHGVSDATLQFALNTAQKDFAGVVDDDESDEEEESNAPLVPGPRVKHDDDWLNQKPAPVHRTTGGVGYQYAADIEPKEVTWLWLGRIARGKMTFLAGPADQGKSQLVCDLVARITTGRSLPNDEGVAEIGTVIMISAEDDADDTIVPRLMAANADMSKVIFVKMMVRVGKGQKRMFNIAEDLKQLSEIVRIHNDVRLVTIDPISAYMGSGKKSGDADTYKTTEVRAVLSPLGDWSARHDIATLFLSHLNKHGGGSALGRMLDSGAFTAIARSGWFVSPEMKDGVETGLKYFTKGKNNIGWPMDNLTYKIVSKQVTTYMGLVLDRPRIEWVGTTAKTSAQAFAQMDGGGEEDKGSALATAITFLKDELAVRAVDMKALQLSAEEKGYSWRTIRRAKDELGIVVTRIGFGPGSKTTWALAAE